MKKNFLILAFLAIGLVTVSPSFSYAASGGSGERFTIGLSGMKLSDSPDGPNVGTTESSTTAFDLKVGYTMASGLYFGGIYNSRTDEAGAKAERSAFGATVGYHNMGWFIDASYFVSATLKYSSSGNELKDGSGFGIDLGHNFDILSNVYIGLQLSYKSFTFNKVGEASVTNKIKSEIMPMINLGVMF